ncbi:MAG: preprotein translocase YidC [Blastopirellula sp.]|nr:preprotein translocase YidC [Blastopirellula sp.]
MEKRLPIFILVAMLVLWGWWGVIRVFNLAPEPPVAEVPDEQGAQEPAEGDDQPPEQPASTGDTDLPAEDPATAAAGDPEEAAPQTFPQEWTVLGSAAADSPYQLLVICNSRGGTIETVELTQRNARGGFLYRDLLHRSGYFGSLGFRYEDGGVRIHVVPKGTAAAEATSPQATSGLQPQDLITTVNGVSTSAGQKSIDEALEGTKPGETIEVAVERSMDDKKRSLTYEVTLSERPLVMMRPEAVSADQRTELCPLSMELSLFSIDETAAKHAEEITDIESLRTRNWQTELSADGTGVTYRLLLTSAELSGIGEVGPIEVVKKYQLPKPAEDPKLAQDPNEPTPEGYHLDVEIAFENKGQSATELAYRLGGPTGLPLEGWWYSNKIHPQWFKVAGARDIVWSEGSKRWLKSTTQLQQAAKNDEVSDLLNSGTQELAYIGVDTQYFSAALLPGESGPDAKLSFERAYGVPLGNFQDKKGRLARKVNSTFEVVSRPETIKAGSSNTHRFRLFIGPKDEEVLEVYGLRSLIYYGMQPFAFFAAKLAWILHFFADIVGNYGLAIVMLTVLVRSCMLPISRKAARNAAMMQELAPEMKKISEKYKDDMQKQRQAQQELFSKHNYNPLGGCSLMFLQLPVFLGLYKCISVDVNLRQAPLIPGMAWCSNLAGPDMAYDWSSWMPEILADPATGWLGPYFNILPVITCCLFLVQQKLFTPPATDEQSAMQQKMMKFMMIFMGVMFFRVASGLCLYFIASTLWGIMERKLLPKPKAKLGDTESDDSPPKPGLMDRIKDAAASAATGNTGNGANDAESAAERRKKRKKLK